MTSRQITNMPESEYTERSVKLSDMPMADNKLIVNLACKQVLGDNITEQMGRGTDRFLERTFLFMLIPENCESSAPLMVLFQWGIKELRHSRV